MGRVGYRDGLCDVQRTAERDGLAGLAELSDAELLHSIDALEMDLATATQAYRVVVTVSGLQALEIALVVAGVHPGARVACDTLYPFAAMAINNVGATPVAVDIDPTTLAPRSASVNAALDNGAIGVVLTPYFGVRSGIKELAEELSRSSCFIVEDRAQCFGPHCEDWLASWSFQSGKVLSCGQGGAVVCPSDRADHEARRAINLGWWPRRPDTASGWSSGWRERGVGRSSRLAPIVAALLRARLPSVGERQARVNDAADRCREALASSSHGATVMQSSGSSTLAILCDDPARREDVARKLRALHLEAGLPTHPPVVGWPGLRELWYSSVPDLAGTTSLLDRLVLVGAMPSTGHNS